MGCLFQLLVPMVVRPAVRRQKLCKRTSSSRLGETCRGPLTRWPSASGSDRGVFPNQLQAEPRVLTRERIEGQRLTGVLPVFRRALNLKTLVHVGPLALQSGL